MWVTLSTAIAEERPREMQGISQWKVPGVLQLPHYHMIILGKVLRMSQSWCFICDRKQILLKIKFKDATGKTRYNTLQ